MSTTTYSLDWQYRKGLDLLEYYTSSQAADFAFPVTTDNAYNPHNPFGGTVIVNVTALVWPTSGDARAIPIISNSSSANLIAAGVDYNPNETVAVKNMCAIGTIADKTVTNLTEPTILSYNLSISCDTDTRLCDISTRIDTTGAEPQTACSKSEYDQSATYAQLGEAGRFVCGAPGARIYSAYYNSTSGYGTGRLVPVKRTTDNAVGLYDVNKKIFYTVPGAIAGPVTQYNWK